MATGKSYLEYIRDQLSDVPEVRFRPMMGEYLLSVSGTLIGGLYDDRLLLKPAETVLALLPDAPREKPYEGGRDMLLVEDTDDRELLAAVLLAAAEAPENRPHGKKNSRILQSGDTK